MRYRKRKYASADGTLVPWSCNVFFSPKPERGPRLEMELRGEMEDREKQHKRRTKMPDPFSLSSFRAVKLDRHLWRVKSSGKARCLSVSMANTVGRTIALPRLIFPPLDLTDDSPLWRQESSQQSWSSLWIREAVDGILIIKHIQTRLQL